MSEQAPLSHSDVTHHTLHFILEREIPHLRTFGIGHHGSAGTRKRASSSVTEGNARLGTKGRSRGRRNRKQGSSEHGGSLHVVDDVSGM
jgi:hypothetical protein